MGNKHREHVTVVGAGVIGVTCALSLRRTGWDVLLLDAEEPAGGASSGNAGSISTGSVVPVAMPGMLSQIPGWLINPSSPLAVRWRYFPTAFPWLVRWLLASSGANARKGAAALAPLTLGAFDAWRNILPPQDCARYLRSNGQLLVSRAKEMSKSDQFAFSLRKGHGVAIDVVSPDELRQLEPELSSDYRWGLFIPSSGHLVDPKATVLALFEEYRRLGGEYCQAQVTHVIRNGVGPVEALGSTAGEIDVDQVVVSAGAYSGRLAALVGDRIPLDTERGYNVTIPESGIVLKRPVSDMSRRFFATSMNTGLRIAGTVEIAGLDASPNYARARALRKRQLSSTSISG